MIMNYKMKMGKDLQPGVVKTHTALPWGLVDRSKENGKFKRIDITPSTDPDVIVYRPIATFMWNEEDERRGNDVIQKKNAEFILKASHAYYPMLKALSDLHHVLSNGEVIVKFPESIPFEEIMESAERILAELGVRVDASDQGDEELSALGEDTEKEI